MVRRIRRDVPTENSSVNTHGHLRKLNGIVTDYMSGTGTWEHISGAATLPAPPDKSVQFNDGLTAFGGSANFTYDKTEILATLAATAPSSTTFAVGKSSNNHFYNFYSVGNGTHNAFDGHVFIGQTLEADGHSAFGGAASPQTYVTVEVKETNTGALAAQTYYGASLDNRYTNTGANNPAIVGASFVPVLTSSSSDAVNTMQGVYGEAYCDTPDEISQVVGGQFDGYFANSTGKATGTITGLIGGAYNFSDNAATLPDMTAIATVVSINGNQVVTAAHHLHIGVAGDVHSKAVNVYGIKIEEQTAGSTKCYNLWSDWNSASSSFGKNFLGSGAQIGSTGTNISEVSGGVLGVGTGASGSVAGKLRAAKVGVAGDTTGSEVLTVTGDGSASGYWNAGSYKVGGAAGASGNFTTVDLKTVTVTNGIIVGIV